MGFDSHGFIWGYLGEVGACVCAGEVTAEPLFIGI
jgi:hypothetical protein